MTSSNTRRAGVSLLVTCHPGTDSLCAHIADRVVDALKSRHATVVVNDLYRMGFSPISYGEDLSSYFDDIVPKDLLPLVADLRSAHELIFILPIWMFDMPAILKGYFDRVWRPYVAFTFDGKDLQPLLMEISRMTVIVAHGRSEAETKDIGDATRDFFSKSLLTLLPNLKSNSRFDFFSLDDGDRRAIHKQLDAVVEIVSRDIA